MKIILLKTFIALLILGACVSDKLLKLASEYTGSIYFYEQAQKNLRLVYSQCEYKKECFQERGMEHIKEGFCPRFSEYKFVSETECHRAGQGIMDLVSGKTHVAVPVNNPTQNAHNDRMYDLERQRLELEKRRAGRGGREDSDLEDDIEELEEEIREARREASEARRVASLPRVARVASLQRETRAEREAREARERREALDQCWNTFERCRDQCTCENQCGDAAERCQDQCDSEGHRCEDQCNGVSQCVHRCIQTASFTCPDQCDATVERCEDQCGTSCGSQCRSARDSCISDAS